MLSWLVLVVSLMGSRVTCKLACGEALSVLIGVGSSTHYEWHYSPVGS